MEGFLEFLRRSRDIAEVNEEYLLLLPELADHRRNVIPFGCQRSLAQGNPVIGARHQINSPLERCRTRQYAGDAADR
ncbi:hypothetical protein D3C75_1252790 [compost metagenome]